MNIKILCVVVYRIAIQVTIALQVLNGLSMELVWCDSTINSCCHSYRYLNLQWLSLSGS